MPRRRPRFPTLLVSAFAGAGLLAAGWLQGQAAGDDILGGAPVATGSSQALTTHTLHNRCHTVGYSEWRADPLWVAYRLRPVKRQGGLGRERFETDERTARRVDYKDYSGSGYDRGHLAPSYAIAALCGKAAQRETFLMSNIAPQKPRLNQKLWQRLEEVELDEFPRLLGEIQVFTGPIFDGRRQLLRSGVDIPDAFYKIYYAPARDGRPAHTLAVVMPQEVQGTEPLERYVTSIDAIEAKTGLDFLSGLDSTTQARLEASASPDPAWRLVEFGHRPPRY